MADWSELKQVAQTALPKCCGESVPTGVEYGGQREMMCCDAWQSDGEVTVNPFDLLQLIAENEQLEALTTLGMSLGGTLRVCGDHQSIMAAQDLLAERDQLRAEVDALKEQLRQVHPFKFSEQGPSQRCMACGEYHYGLGNMPCPKMTPVAYQAVPVNCRQRLAAEGKAYPRSSCAVCGQLSPKWRECDAAMGKGGQGHE